MRILLRYSKFILSKQNVYAISYLVLITSNSKLIIKNNLAETVFYTILVWEKYIYKGLFVDKDPDPVFLTKFRR